MGSMRLGPPQLPVGFRASGAAVAPAAVAPQTDADRRRSIRHAHLTKGLLFDEHAGPAANGREIAVFNVSNHGVGFRCDDRLAPGTVYRVRIGAGPLHLSSFVKLVHARPADDGLTDYGAEFC